MSIPVCSCIRYSQTRACSALGVSVSAAKENERRVARAGSRGAHLKVGADGALGRNFNLHEGPLALEVVAEKLALLVLHLRDLRLDALAGLALDARLAHGVTRARAASCGSRIALVALLLCHVLIGRLGVRVLRLWLLLHLGRLCVGLVRGRLGGAALTAHCVECVLVERANRFKPRLLADGVRPRGCSGATPLG